MGTLLPPDLRRLATIYEASAEYLRVGGSSTTFRLNVDRFGLPRDYATYVWLLYGKVVEDKSPARIAFLYGPRRSIFQHLYLGVS